MAKQAPLKPEVAPRRQEQNLTIQQVIPLSPQEKRELRDIFATPLMRKAWNNVLQKAPSSFGQDFNAALGGVAANNKLHEMRGFEMFKTAFLLESVDVIPKAPKLRETYPDAGLDITT